MGDGPRPFYGVFGPPALEQPQAPEPLYPYFPEPTPPPEDEGEILEGSLLCEHCDEPIQEQDIAVEILLGFLVRSKKSERWVVEQMNDDFTPSIVHDYCCHKFCWDQIAVDIEDHEIDPYDTNKYCAGCSVKLGD